MVFSLPLILFSAAAVTKAQALPGTDSSSSNDENPSNKILSSSWYDSKPSRPSVIHIIVLVHGWCGAPNEMGYIGAELERQYQEILHSSALPPSHKRDKIVLVHSATCNDGRTHDGIEPGGKRLAQEVNQLVVELTTHYSEQFPTTTISFVGNSMGGLYARYALSEIQWAISNENADSTDSLFEESSSSSVPVTIIPHLFVTTATPHLGVASYTYLPIPRLLEVAIARVMGASGRDLFRVSSIIDEMTTSTTFLGPLQQFRKRIAFANCYGTDFQVACETAAFLSGDDTPKTHRIIEKRVLHPTSNGCDGSIVLIVETPRRCQTLEAEDSSQVISVDRLDDVALTTKLDSMGWTKVFCSVQRSIPNVFAVERDTGIDIPEGEYLASVDLLHSKLTRRHHVRQLPIGHTVLVANEKDRISKLLNKGGRPIMDELAKIILGNLDL